MAVELNDAMAKKVPSRRRHGSTEFTGSTASVTSTLPKDVLALGQEIVQNLELDSCGATLERWMAHHLAGLIAEAETATGDARAVAEARATDLILRLWAKRRDLPEAADPLGSCRAAIEVLSRLHPEQNPWLAFHGQGNAESLLADLFDNMAKVVVGGILMVRAPEPRTVTPPEEAALAAEERTLLQQFAWWEAAVKPEPFLVWDDLKQTLIEAEEYARRQDETLDTPLQAGDASAHSTETELKTGSRAECGETSSSQETSKLAVDPTSSTARSRDQLSEALRCLQASLARLVAAWNAKSVSD